MSTNSHLKLVTTDYYSETQPQPVATIQEPVKVSHEIYVGDAAVLADKEPTLLASTNAQLPYLPEPLKLKCGPILVTLEEWSDGTVVARIPALALDACADSDTLALGELGEEILTFASGVKRLLVSGGSLSGPLLRQWNGLNESVDTS